MSQFTTYQNRKKLAEQLPLDTPLSIHICPTTYCNFKCTYCVHSLSDITHLPNGLKKQYMDMQTFQTIVKQIKEFRHKLKLLNFAYLGEPLLNPDIAEMVKIAKNEGIAERVEIVSNASILTEELSRKLVEAGLDRYRVSIQGLNAEEYFKMSKAKIDFEKLCSNLRYLYQVSRNSNTKIYIKTVDTVVETEERKEQFMKLFGDSCDNLNIESLIPISEKCDISDLKQEFKTGFFGNTIQKTEICSEVFFTMVITPSGEVQPCCTMGKPPYYLGNIEEDTIYNIWNGEKLRALRETMLCRGYKAFETCTKCGVPMYQTAVSDYLDADREELKKYYIKQ